MSVSNWYLYVGIFLACTGVLAIPGAVMIGYWFIKYFMDSGGVKGINTDRVKEIKSNYRKGEDRIDEIEAEKTKYKFKGNIGDLKDRERYT